MSTIKLVSLIISILSITACSTVNVTVNSMKNGKIDRTKPIVFKEKGSGIEDEKLRRQCAKGAKDASITVSRECGSNCFWVSVTTSAGSAFTAINASANASTGISKISTSHVTENHVKISVFEDEALSKLKYEAQMDSEDERSNVLSIAREMCEAGFRAYPQEMTDGVINIRSR